MRPPGCDVHLTSQLSSASPLYQRHPDERISRDRQHRYIERNRKKVQPTLTQDFYCNRSVSRSP